MKKIFLLIFGVSLLSGLLIGTFTSEKKYFLLRPTEPKREITYESYKMFSDGSQSRGFDFSKFIKVETVFNIPKAVLSGLTTLGILLIVSYFLGEKGKIIGS